MLTARDTGRLDLPMKGHAYLYSVLVGLADKSEAGAETQAEAQRRTPVQSTVQVRGQTMSIGQGLAQVFGRVDPALAKLDADATRAVPMPASVREKINAMRRRTDTQTTKDQE
jgi:hypothetical protein